MNNSESYSRFLTWFTALLLAALTAGCGGGGGGKDPILGTGVGAGAIPGAPPGAIAPGAVCTAAAGPTIPTVTSSDPTNGNPAATTSTTGVAGGGKLITATFSLTMNPATINSPLLTFTLRDNTTGINVPGTVTMNGTSTIATFTTVTALNPGRSFTAIITQAATSVGPPATPLACIYAWNFTTGAALTGVAPVILGAAAPFGGFGGNAGMTNQGLLTVITGAQGQPVSIGTTAASTLMTGFHDTAGCAYTESPLNVGRVDGTIITDAPPPIGTSPPICAITEGNAATKAIADAAAAAALAAFIDLAGRPGATDPGANLGGLTLAPGVYATASGAFLITGSDLTLDAGGNPDAVWVFQMASSLTVGLAAAPRSVILAGGAQPKNVFWQVGSAADINLTGGGTMVGTIISSAATRFSTPGNPCCTVLNGRALALNASVTMVNTVINVPSP